MEIYFVLLFIGLVNWFLIKEMSISMPVPRCTTCNSVNTLGHNESGFVCTSCGDGYNLADVNKYERDVEILLSEPEQYEHYKQSRQSFIDMGYGTEKN
jgi:tRNA(Ile2) C34 agmatinyltransferase TiaS